MIIRDTNPNIDLRAIFCNAVVNVFEDSTKFLDFLEFEGYSSKYDCFLDPNGENYIINTDTGEYINWYKMSHIGRCINISILEPSKDITKWFEDFLLDLKYSHKKEVS